MLAYLDLGADVRHARRAREDPRRGGRSGGATLEAFRAAAKVLAAAPAGQGPLDFANAIFVDPAGEIFPAAIDRLRNAGMEAEIEPLSGPEGWRQSTAGSPSARPA